VVKCDLSGVKPGFVCSTCGPDCFILGTNCFNLEPQLFRFFLSFMGLRFGGGLLKKTKMCLPFKYFERQKF